MAETIVTREEARLQGLARYFNGRPCPQGHLAERRTKDAKCIECSRARARDHSRASYRKNPERVRAALKKWGEENPDKRRESNRKSKEANQEKYNATQRADYAKNPEKYKAAWKRYYEKKRDWHIERAVITERKRRAQKKGSGGSHTRADLAVILAAQGHRCAYCGTDLRKAKKHLDHVMPLALGGSNDKSNLAWACAPCNLSKGARHPIEFAQAQGRLL